MRPRSGWLVGGALAAVAITSAAAAASGREYVAVALVTAAEVAAIVALLVRHERVRWLLPAVAPVLVAAVVATYGGTERGVVLGASIGDPSFERRTAVLAGIGALAAILLAAGVDVGGWLARGVAVLVRSLTWALGAVGFALIVLPGWAWTRLRRRRALRSPGGWQPVAPAGGPGDLFAGAPDGAMHRSLTGRISWAIGCVVLLVALDYGLGWTWDQAFPTTEAPVAEAPTTSNAPVPRDPRIDSPAMADAPWRERYFADLQRTSGGYWPFVESRPSDFTSPYVNLRGWERRTYQPDGDPDAMPLAYMFGGSTTWGEGQRDEYTIASWVARLSEEAGTPVEVRNFGQRGWTHFQEMILYEQVVAAGPVPDLAIFYDGANEITAQSLLDEAVPTHTLALAYARKLSGQTIATEFLQEPEPVDPIATALDAYAEHSAVNKLVGLFRSQPAGAAARQDGGGDPGEGFTEDQQEDEAGIVSNYEMTEQDGIDAGQVYERGKRLTLEISDHYDIEPFLFWQPVREAGPPQQRAIEELSDTTIDISDALDGHRDVYIDGGHTNEAGARIVAEAIWERLEPSVRAWYRANG